MKLELNTERLRLTPFSDADFDLALEMFTDPEVVEYVCDLMNEEQIRSELDNWKRRGWRRVHRDLVYLRYSVAREIWQRVAVAGPD